MCAAQEAQTLRNSTADSSGSSAEGCNNLVLEETVCTAVLCGNGCCRAALARHKSQVQPKQDSPSISSLQLSQLARRRRGRRPVLNCPRVRVASKRESAARHGAHGENGARDEQQEPHDGVQEQREGPGCEYSISS